jgi:hypothetical protein
MRSQDGFEVVNRLVREEPVSRRTVLRAVFRQNRIRLAWRTSLLG